MTTTASKRMRIAALGLSTALSVGILAPFIGTSEASAATTCSTASANYAKANTKLKSDQAKFKKAKKKLRKAKRARKSVAVIRHKKKVAKRIQKHVKADKARRAAAYKALQTCVTPGKGGTNTPAGTANPLSDLIGKIQATLAGAGAPAQLVDALSQLQSVLSNIPVPAGMDPAAFQKVLTDAAAQIQSELTAALADPTGMTAAGLIDDIINPIVSGLTTAGVPGLPDVLTGLQGTLDPILSGLGLGALGGGNPLGALTGLLGGGLPIPGL